MALEGYIHKYRQTDTHRHRSVLLSYPIYFHALRKKVQAYIKCGSTLTKYYQNLSHLEPRYAGVRKALQTDRETEKDRKTDKHTNTETRMYKNGRWTIQLCINIFSSFLIKPTNHNDLLFDPILYWGRVSFSVRYN